MLKHVCYVKADRFDTLAEQYKAYLTTLPKEQRARLAKGSFVKLGISTHRPSSFLVGYDPGDVLMTAEDMAALEDFLREIRDRSYAKENPIG
jgi:hypothetical protein